MSNNHLIEKALQMAMDAHRGQVDKGGAPYILHPIRVMLSVRTETEKVVALLHDIIEETHVTYADIEQTFGTTIADAVNTLTRNTHEDYSEYMQGVADNPITRAVKIADLRDNMDVTRLSTVTDKDIARLQKYRNYYDILNKI